MIERIKDISELLARRNDALHERSAAAGRVKCSWSVAVVAKAVGMLGDQAKDPWSFPRASEPRLNVDDLVDLLFDVMSMGSEESYDPRSLALQVRNAVGYGTNLRNALLRLIAAAAASGSGGNYPNVRDAFAVLVVSCGHEIERLLDRALERLEVVSIDGDAA